MIKHFCDMCGEHYGDEDDLEDLVTLATGWDDAFDEVILEEVCPVCCNKIKEFIVSVQKEKGVKIE